VKYVETLYVLQKENKAPITPPSTLQLGSGMHFLIHVRSFVWARTKRCTLFLNNSFHL